MKIKNIVLIFDENPSETRVRNKLSTEWCMLIVLNNLVKDFESNEVNGPIGKITQYAAT